MWVDNRPIAGMQAVGTLQGVLACAAKQSATARNQHNDKIIKFGDRESCNTISSDLLLSVCHDAFCLSTPDELIAQQHGMCGTAAAAHLK